MPPCAAMKFAPLPPPRRLTVMHLFGHLDTADRFTPRLAVRRRSLR
jgi:hypothetical protein